MTTPPTSPPTAEELALVRRIDAVLYQMATFQDGNAQTHTIALINEMADLLQAFAGHAQQAREQADSRIAELEAALRDIQIEAERENGSWVHLKRVIGLKARTAIKEHQYDR